MCLYVCVRTWDAQRLSFLFFFLLNNTTKEKCERICSAKQITEVAGLDFGSFYEQEENSGAVNLTQVGHFFSFFALLANLPWRAAELATFTVMPCVLKPLVLDYLSVMLVIIT